MGAVRHRRRGRVTARGWLVLALLVGGGLTAAVVLSAAGAPAHDSTSSATTSSPPTTSPLPASIGTYRVGTTTINVVEPEGSAPARSLPTTVWFPESAYGRPAAAHRAHSPYPLLVFSQGYDISVSSFATLILDWASAGFVVAAPVYPHTDPSDPTGLDENDIVNHPADLHFVISSVLAKAQEAGSPLSGMVDAAAVGVVGHSDGGDVSLAVADNSCCQDQRVKAAAILSGAELSAFGGTYFGRQVPLLVVQGMADTINPPGCSVQIYNGAAAPKYYLELLGAEHAPPYIDAGSDQEVIARVTTDFFDAELAGQPSGITSMAADGNVAGLTQLSSALSAPAPPSSCPGAPG